MEKIRIGCISGWQSHADKFALLAQGYEESEVVALWDEDAERGARNAAAVGCARVESYMDILNNPEIDAVIIMSSPLVHAEHVIAAAKAGKHIYVEKPLCYSDEDAKAIYSAVKAAGVHFTLSDPIFKPTYRYVKQMLEDGVIGRPVSARCRCSFGMYTGEKLHDPAKIQRAVGFGGALGDSHSGHVLQGLFGTPVRATAMMKKDPTDTVDINTVSVYEFSNGVLGVAEACVVGKGCPYALEIYGEEGDIYSTREEIFYRLGKEPWQKIPEENLPEAYDYVLHAWVMNIVENRPEAVYTLEDAVDLIRMQNASREAAGYSVAL